MMHLILNLKNKNNVSLNLMQRLFKYIDGGNEDEVKIPMTSPVLVDVEPSCGPFCKNNFTVSFFVPFDFQVIY
jgi:hypothetical protein